ncbi:unnamed protein product [Peniophora sp. CBMAI 1063]|nr:unnamed protein product [Peniophora sp. CBMAI 1063]
MIDPVITPQLVGSFLGLSFKGLRSIVTHEKNGEDSKKAKLEMASRLLSGMAELLNDLGKDLNKEDRDKYRTFIEDYGKDIKKLMRKVWGGKTATSKVHSEIQLNHAELYSKSTDIRKAREAGQASGQPRSTLTTMSPQNMPEGVSNVGQGHAPYGIGNIQAQVVNVNNNYYSSPSATQGSPTPSEPGSGLLPHGGVISTGSPIHDPASEAQMERGAGLMAEMEEIRGLAKVMRSGFQSSLSLDERASLQRRFEELKTRLEHANAGAIKLLAEVAKDVSDDAASIGTASLASDHSEDSGGSIMSLDSNISSSSGHDS